MLGNNEELRKQILQQFHDSNSMIHLYIGDHSEYDLT